MTLGGLSLSARRAWIEMPVSASTDTLPEVALRKESVDRNPPMCTIRQMPLTSLSARRAWIEMPVSASTDALPETVALRKESVDRNDLLAFKVQRLALSLSARRAWIEIFPPAQKK